MTRLQKMIAVLVFLVAAIIISFSGYVIYTESQKKDKTSESTQTVNKEAIQQKVIAEIDAATESDFDSTYIIIQFEKDKKDEFLKEDIAKQVTIEEELGEDLFVVKVNSQSDIKNLAKEINKSENVIYAELNYIGSLETGNNTFTSTAYGFTLNYPNDLYECCGISGPAFGNYDELMTIGNVPPGTAGSDAPFNGFAVFVVKDVNMSLEQYKQKEIEIWDARSVEFGSGLEESNFTTATFAGQNALICDNPNDNIKRVYMLIPNTPHILVISVIEESTGSFPEQTAILNSLTFSTNVNNLSNDTFINSHWNWHNTNDIDVNAFDAWEVEGENEVVVAVIDTGIKLTHPDLDDKLWVNTDEIADNDIDDDNNGYIDDVYGMSLLLNEEQNINDYLFHGTAVSSIIAAERNNNEGIAGLCSTCKIMTIKFEPTPHEELPEDPEVELDVIRAVKAFRYAMDNGADVINCSWVIPFYSQSLQNVINEAYANEIITVAAAGNANADMETYVLDAYPSMMDNVISVGAIDSSGNKSEVSNYGKNVDVSAPSTFIPVANTYRDDNYIVPTTLADWYTDDAYWAPDFGGGTSWASPHVAAVVAMVKSKYPEMTADTIVELVTEKAVKTNLINSDKYIGHGYIDAYKALTWEFARDLDFEITSPSILQVVSSDIVITGTVKDPVFENYKVFIGTGLYPTTYSELATSTNQVDNGTIHNLDISNLENGYYTIKVQMELEVADDDIKFQSEYVRIKVEK